jgi:hydrogenase-4 component H
MKYPKLRELKEAIGALVSPAYTTSFPSKPHTPQPGYRGKPEVNDELCIGCETCANVCPPHAITVEDDKEKGMRTITRDFGKCIFCGLCETHCITGEGVKLSDKVFDLAVFDRGVNVEKQQKELILCKNCGAIITTKEHMHFIHRKLGTKGFSNILNLNLLNERLGLVDSASVDVEVMDHLKRKDMFNILCPNCLRRVLVNELI